MKTTIRSLLYIGEYDRALPLAPYLGRKSLGTHLELLLGREPTRLSDMMSIHNANCIGFFGGRLQIKLIRKLEN